MLHKCANPECLTAFRSLGHGKLFQMESKQLPLPGDAYASRRLKIARRVERYWLCDQCALSLTLASEKGGGVATVPLPNLSRRAFIATQA